MRRSTALAITAVIMLTVPSIQAKTATYSFVTAQSTVRQTNASAGIDRYYSIAGSMQLSVDSGSGIARFDWVDAVLSPAVDLETADLEELFRMNELVGTAVSATTIEFSLTDTSTGADDKIEITVNLSGNSAVLSGRRTQLLAGGSVFDISASALQQSTDWSYHYMDDFSTGKAQRDSCSHAVFWPGQAYPPDEPHLHYYGGKEGRSLVFVDFQGQPAHLGYRFPIGANAYRPVRGVLELDVEFPSNETISQSPPGYMLYSLSSDGHIWSTPTALQAGHQQLQLESLRGACHVMLLGARAAVDNLEVHLTSTPATIHVPGDFGTIQAAIDASVDGDVIEVAVGIYRGDGNTDLDFHGKAITLQSADGPEATVIDCAGSAGSTALQGTARVGTQQGHQRRGFYFHSAETRRSILRGFTIRSGRIEGDSIPADGMRWDLNPAHPIGGGIYCEFASPTIVDCVVRNCSAEYGGGIGCVGGQPVIAGCLIENCDAGGHGTQESGGYGGGLAMIRQCEVSISDCIIRQNSSYYNSFGAGIYCRTAVARITDCDISFNGPTLETNLTSGGGVYCSDSMTVVELTNCIMSHNSAHLGSGVYAEAGQLIPGQPTCRVRITNCTVAENRILPGPWLRPLIDAAIESFGCDTTVKNTIAYYNEGIQITITDPAVNSPVVYSNVQNGYPGSGNIDQPPLFAPVDSRDYHLQSVRGRYDPRSQRWVNDSSHSPCIDAGDPTDYAGGEPMPNGRRINMGAYGGTAQASKGLGSLVYHVDTVGGNDSNNGLSRRNAFATIQKGVDASSDGDVVLVWPGTYREQVRFNHKAITVQSAADAAHVIAPSGYAFSFYLGEGPDSVLRNFVISGGQYGVYCNSSFPTLSNLTIVDNEFGITAYGGADPNISNCIFWNNNTGDLFDCQAHHSRLRRGQFGSGQGNIDDNPMFADPNNDDYHLLSENGRYWPLYDLWVLDKKTSPCIDAGDPALNPGRERAPNGGKVNMGAYGGTPHASMSRWRLRGDANRDGIVSFKDLAIMAAEWLDREDWVSDSAPVIVIPGSGQVFSADGL